MIYTVSLQEIEFKAYHGIYDFEKKQGNNFYLSITLTQKLPDEYEFTDLNHTIDYEIMYQLAKPIMEEANDLLEQVLQLIAKAVAEKFKYIQTLQLTLAKENPPIGAKCKRSEVSLSFNY